VELLKRRQRKQTDKYMPAPSLPPPPPPPPPPLPPLPLSFTYAAIKSRPPPSPLQDIYRPLPAPLPPRLPSLAAVTPYLQHCIAPHQVKPSSLHADGAVD